ncbi:hypothetical protein J6590_075200 [Homalodisca vitripennis]|nr:hypothetical protein J6590_075200 [Homalodisca vitripennis]
MGGRGWKGWGWFYNLWLSSVVYGRRAVPWLTPRPTVADKTDGINGPIRSNYANYSSLRLTLRALLRLNMFCAPTQELP